MAWKAACCATAFSVSLDRNSKLLTGRKFFFISSSLGFLIVGFTSAPFHSSGNTPDSRERLMIDEIAGDNSSTHCLTILVGSGSLAHDFEGALLISFCTEANEMLLNFEKGVPLNVENEQSSESVLDTLVPRPTRMFTILRYRRTHQSH